MKKMHIAFSVHHFMDVNSGASGATAALAQHLEALGHQARIYSFDDLPRWFNALPTKIHGRLAPLVFPVFLVFCLIWQARKFDVLDLMSGDGWLAHWIVSRFLRPSRRPLLVTHSAGLEHVSSIMLRKLAPPVDRRRAFIQRVAANFDAWMSQDWTLWTVKTATRCADVRYFLNRVDAKYAALHFKIDPRTIHLMPNGLPACLLALPAPRSLKGDKIQIVQVGRYTPAKGTLFGAAALTHVMRQEQGVSVAFLGAGCTLQEVLKDFPLDLHPRISVLASYERCSLPDLVKHAAISLLPTLAEGFGMAILESMACGCAAITTRTPGPREFVIDGRNGLLVTPYDSDALAHALLRLVQNRAECDAMRMAAWSDAQTYNWKQLAQQRASTYSTAIAVSRGTP